MSYLTRSKSDDDAGSNNWETRQKKAFTKWINAKLEGRGLQVEDLFTDLRDGVVLYNLLEVLANQVTLPMPIPNALGTRRDTLQCMDGEEWALD